jgi:hypothetical protein
VRSFSPARVDTRNEIRDFLTSRRAKLTAADVGLPDYGTHRMPRLRREEVAVLAGVSVWQPGWGSVMVKWGYGACCGALPSS